MTPWVMQAYSMFVDTVPAISSREGQLIKAIVQVRFSTPAFAVHGYWEELVRFPDLSGPIVESGAAYNLKAIFQRR